MSSTTPKPIFKGTILKRVFSFVKPYRFVFLANVVLSIVLAFATPVRPYLIQATVNIAIGKSVALPVWLKWILPTSAMGEVTKLIIAIYATKYMTKSCIGKCVNLIKRLLVP